MKTSIVSVLLSTICLFSQASAQAGEVSVDNLVRSQGDYATFTWQGAFDACKSQGKRLATALELVSLFYPDGLRSDGTGKGTLVFKDFAGSESARNVYFNNAGFDGSDLLDKDYVVWSGTLVEEDPAFANERFAFSGRFGLVEMNINYYGHDLGMWKGKPFRPNGGLALCVKL